MIVWGDGVVPFAVELGTFEGDGGYVCVRYDNAAGVLAGVEFTAHSEAGFGGSGRNQLDDQPIADERLGAPVLADEGEEAVFDFVPLAGAGRQVADRDIEAEFVGQLLEFAFPQPHPRTVAAPAPSLRWGRLGGDQQSGCLGIARPTDGAPPLADAIDGERGRVMVNADTHPTGIGGEVVDPVRHRAAELVGASRRRCGVTTTRRDKEARPAPDLVDRNFVASRPNQLWVADITFVPTASGFLYLAVVLDAWSRKLVGWSMANHLRTELVLDALEMAIGQRRPHGVIHHSDQGSQYTSLAFGKRCKEAGLRPSMGSVGDAYDNAMCESFFATLECELLERRRFASQAEAKMACFSFIEGWYNPARRHSALGYRSPIAYEHAMEVQPTEA